MSLELEVSRSFLRNVILSAALIGFTMLGYYSSPRSEDGRPMLLTPGLARVIQYQKQAQDWMARIEEVNAELAAILEQSPADLFSQDRQISQAYGWLVALREEMDGTDAPPTLESLHSTLTGIVAGYLDAATLTAKWAGEPTEANHLNATESLQGASQQFQQVLENPWLQVGP